MLKTSPITKTIAGLLTSVLAAGSVILPITMASDAYGIASYKLEQKNTSTYGQRAGGQYDLTLDEVAKRTNTDFSDLNGCNSAAEFKQYLLDKYEEAANVSILDRLAGNTDKDSREYSNTNLTIEESDGCEKYLTQHKYLMGRIVSTSHILLASNDMKTAEDIANELNSWEEDKYAPSTVPGQAPHDFNIYYKNAWKSCVSKYSLDKDRGEDGFVGFDSIDNDVFYLYSKQYQQALAANLLDADGNIDKKNGYVFTSQLPDGIHVIMFNECEDCRNKTVNNIYHRDYDYYPPQFIQPLQEQYLSELSDSLFDQWLADHGELAKAFPDRYTIRTTRQAGDKSIGHKRLVVSGGESFKLEGYMYPANIALYYPYTMNALLRQEGCDQ